jgi:hypothetical protein
MLYVNHRSHRMQKHKFGVTCPSSVFVESVSVPLEHEIWCDDFSHPRGTGMHNLTRGSHRLQKHKFGVTCHDAIFVESIPVPPLDKK